MNIEKIRHTVKVGELESFSEAAYALYTSQSSVSKHVSSLESALGIKLFIRRGRSVVLSEAGTRLMPLFKQIVSDYDRILQEARFYSDKNSHKLVIGSTPLRKDSSILQMISQLSKSFPRLQLEIVEGTYRNLMDKLNCGTLDIAIVAQTFLDGEPCDTCFSERESQYCIQPLLKDNYYAVMNKEHPFAQKQNISIGDIANERFIFVSKRFTPYYSMMARVSERYNINFNIAATADSFATAIDLVCNSNGIAILSPNVITKTDSVSLVPLQESLYRTTSLVVPPQRLDKPWVQWLMNYIKCNYYINTDAIG